MQAHFGVAMILLQRREAPIERLSREEIGEKVIEKEKRTLGERAELDTKKGWRGEEEEEEEEKEMVENEEEKEKEKHFLPWAWQRAKQ